jgi:hypothetical protein
MEVSGQCLQASNCEKTNDFNMTQLHNFMPTENVDA